MPPPGVPVPSPGVPQSGNEGALAGLIDPESPLGQMFDSNNPDGQMALLQLGMSMMQPQQPGTNFGQNMIGSFGDAMNYLGSLEATRNEQMMEERAQATREQLGTAQAGLLDAQTQDVPRQADQTDMANAIDLFEAKTDEQKSRMVFEAAIRKANTATDDRKKILLEGLMKIQQEKMTQNGTFDFEEMMTMTNLIEAGFDPTFDDFHYLDGQLVMNAKLLEDVDPETGLRKNNYLPVSAETVVALGLDPKKIQERSNALLKAQADRSTVDVSQELDPNLELTTGEPNPPAEPVINDANEIVIGVMDETVRPELTAEETATRQALLLKLRKSKNKTDNAVARLMRADLSLTEKEARLQVSEGPR